MLPKACKRTKLCQRSMTTIAAFTSVPDALNEPAGRSIHSVFVLGGPADSPTKLQPADTRRAVPTLRVAKVGAHLQVAVALFRQVCKPRGENMGKVIQAHLA